MKLNIIQAHTWWSKNGERTHSNEMPACSYILAFRTTEIDFIINTVRVIQFYQETPKEKEGNGELT